MRILLTLALTALFSSQAFGTIGVTCATAGHDITFVYADPYVGPELGNSPPVHTIDVEGEPADAETASVVMSEYDSKCEEGGSHGDSCRMYMKVDLDGNGKFEFEFEVWRQEKTSDEGGVDYYGRMIDYRSGKKSYLDASCRISN